LRDSRSLTLSYNFSLEILAYSEPVNANVSNEVTAQLSSFDQSIQELSDRIDSLPNKLLQTNAQIENTNQNEAQLLVVLLGILS
jgi:TolA-binding protein